MFKQVVKRTVLLALLSTTVITPAAAQPTSSAPSAAPRFELTFDRAVCDGPFTGRVWVVVTKRRFTEPVELVHWFWSEPIFARDVRDWQPGETLTFTSDNCLGYPAPLAELPANAYRAQAVLGLDDWGQHPVLAPGNARSDVAQFEHTPDRPAAVRLVIDRRNPPPAVRESRTVRHVKLRSHLLSEFHRRDVHMEALVGLPDNYGTDKARRFPTVYEIPGFDGRLESIDPTGFQVFLSIEGLDAVVVALAASCPTGHHVFADSANNGPWGTALVRELIPHLEQEYRLIADPAARLLTGASSGGWSSLWLQITHPDVFGGVWSLCPDPVDFTRFMQLNIYEPGTNAYVGPDGAPRSFTRPGFFFGRIAPKSFLLLEQVLGRGGQIASFEAVFSPRGEDGAPLPLVDRRTGALNPQVAQAWRKYDIRLVLEANWATLGPKLAGKLHIICGELDEFYLEQGVESLHAVLQQLGSDAAVRIIPEAGHMLPSSVYSEVAAEMAERLRRLDKIRQQATPDSRAGSGENG
jgi:S-formylglutathione hydrolase FrmB